jgi:hypothetical protein
VGSSGGPAHVANFLPVDRIDHVSEGGIAGILPMSLPEHFEVVESIGVYRPVATVSFQEATALVIRALDCCQESGIKRMLIDIRGLTGFKMPTAFQRFSLGEQVAAHSNGITIAMVLWQEMIDPKRIGVTVARNRGAMGDVFSSEVEAMNWLRAQ